MATEQHEALSPAEHPCSLPWLPKKPLQVCHLAAGTLRPFLSQAMRTWGSGRFVLLASEAGYAQLGFHLGPGSVCICMCLPEENCPDLHYGGQSCLLGSCLRCQY